MNPAIPITIAIIVLGGAAFAGWWFVGRGGSATSTTSGTASSVFPPGTNGGLATTGGLSDDTAAATQVAMKVFNGFYSTDFRAIYDNSALGPAISAKFPTVESFIEDATGNMSQQDLAEIRSALTSSQAGAPSIVGDQAMVPISFTATIKERTISGVASVKLVKWDGVWKLDLTGDEAAFDRVMKDAIGASSIQQQMAPTTTTGATTGSTAGDTDTGSTTGSTTGQFDYTTGTTGMSTGG